MALASGIYVNSQFHQIFKQNFVQIAILIFSRNGAIMVSTKGTTSHKGLQKVQKEELKHEKPPRRTDRQGATSK